MIRLLQIKIKRLQSYPEYSNNKNYITKEALHLRISKKIYFLLPILVATILCLSLLLILREKTGLTGDTTTLSDEPGLSVDTTDTSSNLSDFVIENGVLLEYKGNGGDVVIPGNITKISAGAFANTALKKIVIPGNVKELKEWTLSGCVVEKVIISEGVTKIGSESFWDIICDTIEIPASVTLIENFAFAFSTVSNIKGSSENQYYKDIDGVLFTRDGTTLVRYPSAKSGIEYTIPDSVTQIRNGAFSYNKNIQKVFIPQSVTSIGAFAFNRCENLEFVNIPENIKILEECTFQLCKSLKSIYIPDSVEVIGRYAFNECVSLSDVTLPNGLKTIDTCAFNNCARLKSIIIPQSVTKIGFSAFYGCSSLSDVSLPETADVESQAFKGTLWQTTRAQEFVIENGVLKEYSGAGGDVVIPEGVVQFYAAHDFKFFEVSSITLPSTFNHDQAFPMLRQITDKIYVSKDNKNFINVDGVIFTPDMKTLVAYNLRSEAYAIPDGVEIIGLLAFYECSHLTKLTIPDSIKEIKYYAFYGCNSLTDIDVKQDGRVIQFGDGYFDVPWLNTGGFVIEDGVIIDYVGIGGNVVIPDGVTAIAANAFENARIKSIKIPDSVKSIGKEAFKNCFWLYTVELPENISIGEDAFIGSTLVIFK